MHWRIIALMALVLLAGCEKPAQEALGPVARPVKSIVVHSPEGGGIRNFPGRIESAKRADLAFRVGGTLAELAVQKGAPVEPGELLARLDQTDFEITLKDRQATWNRTNKDFTRAKELVAKGALSRQDFDAVEADFKTADAALAQAKQNLEYTFIRAPFAGQVAERHVDNFEEIQPGQAVYSIIDRDALEVDIDVPENIILSISAREATGPDAKPIKDRLLAWASFDPAPDKRLPLTFKEASRRADAQTQTFKVTLSLPRMDDVTVFPGMTTNVTLDLSALIDSKAVYYLPLTAVVGSADLSPRVWSANEKTMTVHARPVTLGRMVGANIEILAGLEPGLRVVTAGAGYLDEGMKVTLMKQTEQAEPRDTPAQAAG